MFRASAINNWLRASSKHANSLLSYFNILHLNFSVPQCPDPILSYCSAVNSHLKIVLYLPYSHHRLAIKFLIFNERNVPIILCTWAANSLRRKYLLDTVYYHHKDFFWLLKAFKFIASEHNDLPQNAPLMIDSLNLFAPLQNAKYKDELVFRIHKLIGILPGTYFCESHLYLFSQDSFFCKFKLLSEIGKEI